MHRFPVKVKGACCMRRQGHDVGRHVCLGRVCFTVVSRFLALLRTSHEESSAVGHTYAQGRQGYERMRINQDSFRATRPPRLKSCWYFTTIIFSIIAFRCFFLPECPSRSCLLPPGLPACRSVSVFRREPNGTVAIIAEP